VLEERIQAILRMANPDHFESSSHVELLETAQPDPFEIAIRPPSSELDSIVEMVDQLKKYSDEEVVISRFHCQIHRRYFGVVRPTSSLMFPFELPPVENVRFWK